MPLTFFYRLLSVVLLLLPIRLRLKIWMHLFEDGTRRWKPEGCSQRIPGGMYIKWGKLIRLAEGQITHFVETHTPLPVPIVIDNFTVGENTYLVTSRLPGKPLSMLYPELTPEQECRLSEQLSRILAPLRALSAPSGLVCGWNGASIYCERLSMGSRPAGPFLSVDAFHQTLMVRTGGLEIPDDEAETVWETITKAHSRPHRLCLTHNDLGPHNVLVDDDWKITGIVDWEAAGWLPEYWELTKGTFLPFYRKGRWHRILSAALPGYALEQEAEKYIVKYRKIYT
ncbi:hypothetical protein E4T56_gene1398 [Termitomyces sp. T112]|nr:hypothetical protein E4T56_gene1398 [Termitomyces sp. T112]